MLENLDWIVAACEIMPRMILKTLDALTLLEYIQDQIFGDHNDAALFTKDEISRVDCDSRNGFARNPHQRIDQRVAAERLNWRPVVHEAVQGMIERQNGKIIDICSLMSDFGRTGTGPHTASKGGLKMLTKAMCADWAGYNIRINGIAPGYFITEMTQKLADDLEFDAWVKKRTPAGRRATQGNLSAWRSFSAPEAVRSSMGR